VTRWRHHVARAADKGRRINGCDSCREDALEMVSNQ
jgi:hypothetical protein